MKESRRTRVAAELSESGGQPFVLLSEHDQDGGRFRNVPLRDSDENGNVTVCLPHPKFPSYGLTVTGPSETIDRLGRLLVAAARGDKKDGDETSGDDGEAGASE